MGTQVHCKSYSPGYCVMRDFNKNSNSPSWPLIYNDKTLSSGHYYNGYTSRSIADACPDNEKDSLKLKMLEHEAVFKNQVYELHRVYKIQREMMEEVRRQEAHRRHVLIEPSSSPSPQGSQLLTQEARKWTIPSFPFTNSDSLAPLKSGAELVSSPLNFIKGNNALIGLVNASTSKDYEVLEVRPSKVRKDLFDLQLPADEYVDTEEREPFHKSSIANGSSSLPKGNSKIPAAKYDKLFLNGCSSDNDQRATATTESCPGSSMRLADLNEPVDFEDRVVPSSADLLVSSAYNGGTKGLNRYTKPGADFFGLQKEIKTNNLHVKQFKSPDHIRDKGSGRDKISGLKESNFGSMPRRLQQHQLPLPSKVPQFVSQSPAIALTDYDRSDLFRERTDHCWELDRIRDDSNRNHSQSVMRKQIQHQHALVSSSELGNSRSLYEFSWRNSASSLTEKLSSFSAHTSLKSSANPIKNSQSSAQSHEILGEKTQSKGNSRLNRGFGYLQTMNGSYHGSSSGSKETLPLYASGGFCDLDCNGSDNATCGPSINCGPDVVLKAAKPIRVTDLNAVHSKGLPNELVFLQDVEVLNEKSASKGHLTVLPWLTAKPVTGREAVKTGIDANSDDFSLFKASPLQLYDASVSRKDDNKMPQTSNDCENYMNGGVQGITKILGFPIFYDPSTTRKEVLSPVSTLVTFHQSFPGVEHETERRKVIDINLACEEEAASEVLPADKEIDIKLACSRGHIDLNSCISEEEGPLAPCAATNTSSVQVVVDMDVEALALETIDIRSGELEQHEVSSPSTPKAEEMQEDIAKRAAEAILLLSSSTQQVHEEENPCQPSKDSLVESLLWLVDAVCILPMGNKGSKEVKRSDGLLIVNHSDEMDDFEVMTLQLQEIKEEDYMPRPFVLEAQRIEEMETNSISNRPRRGQARRGRQCRDFLRDILPGLASLSRLEVTEDLQTFEGLMKAMGHTWNPVSRRRNGTRNRGPRGRRRIVVNNTTSCTTLMEQLNHIGAFLESHSLKGWGKRTRRPRRARCPAASLAAIALA